MKKLFLISFLFIFIVSCQSQATITPMPITLTNTPEPTSTPTQSPTLIPTATQTKTIEFPDWVKNPDTQILLVPVGTQDKGYENMALFNAETGERFDIPFTEEVGDYFWMPDGSGFGFLPSKQDQFVLFSITNGTKSLIPVSKEARKYLNESEDTADPLQILISNFTENNFLLLTDWEIISSNNKYFVFSEKDKYTDTYLRIFDIENNTILYLSDPGDGFFNFSSDFSPNSQSLAIVEVDQEPNLENRYKPVPIFRLRIYDISTQQVIASYKDVTFPKWSPDGNKFLFQELIKGSDGSAWFNPSSPPCIFDTLSGQTECNNLDYGLATFLEWSPNEELISFINVKFNSTGDIITDFCIISLSSKNEECILENIENNTKKPTNYKWSPDSNFISFTYSIPFPNNSYIGIVAIITGKYFSIGESFSYRHLGLWRP